MPNNFEYLHGKDLHYNNRHKEYGQLPASDIDLIEFNQYDQPVLVQEIKHVNTCGLKLTDMRKLINVANKLQVPFLITVYYFLHFKGGHWQAINAYQDLSVDHIQYFVYPGNSQMAVFIPAKGKLISEREYVQLLHQIKGTEPPNLEPFFAHTLEETNDVCTFLPEII